MPTSAIELFSRLLYHLSVNSSQDIRDTLDFFETLPDRIEAAVASFHSLPLAGVPLPVSTLEACVMTICLCNHTQWHLENRARNPVLSDREIREVKIAIDLTNQERHDQIESLDQALLLTFERDQFGREALPFNSETIGSIVDRYCVLTLKRQHLAEALESTAPTAQCRKLYQQNLGVIEQQRFGLYCCLTQLLDEVVKGSKRLTLFRQFKTYNDPILNPEIRGLTSSPNEPL